jgi:D-alanine-D-alanine ligase
LEEAIEKAVEHTKLVIVQQLINGTEATCGVLEKPDGEVVALPPTRIIPNKGEFYDYKSKYAAGGSTHVCPADFDPTVNRAIQEAALTAHRALGCYGMSRTDCIIGDDGELYVLETNTIPGMTPTSLLPEAAKAAGIEFSEMIDMLIEGGLKRS